MLTAFNMSAINDYEIYLISKNLLRQRSPLT